MTYPLEIRKEVIEFVKKGNSFAETSRKFEISLPTIYSWVKNPEKHLDESNLLDQIYDFNLFKTLNNTKFADKYNISKERARQLRMEFAKETYISQTEKAIQKLHKLILNYIQNNPNEIYLKDFCNNYKISYRTNLKENITKVAEKNNIKISFGKHGKNCSKYEHGNKCNRKKCKCEIGILANNIRMHFYVRKIKITTKIIDYWANEYLDFYIEDDSNGHKIFYDKMEKEVLANELSKFTK